MNRFSLAHLMKASTALAGLLLASGAAYAQQAPAAPSPVNLGDIEVSASRGTPLDKMDISTTVVSHEQIVRSPEISVDQILNKVAGVFIPQQLTNQLHPTGQVLSIRGFGTSTNGLTLVLVDGIPVNDPYFRTVNWAQIPKDSIERIEIIRGGGATSLWGNMAMGGVINIVTRQPQAREGSLQSSYGSFNTFSTDASLGYAINDMLRIGATYDGTRTDGYDQTPAQYRNPAMDATASTLNNFTLSGYFNPDAKSNYFVKLLVSDTREYGLTYNIAHNDWTTYRISFGGQTELAAKTTLNVNGWYQGSGMNTVNASNASYTLATPTLGSPYVSQREDATYTTFGSSVYLQTEFGDLKDFKIGVDGRSISTDDPLNIYKATGYQGDITAKATNAFEGLFAQGTYRVGPLPLDVTLGLREDFWQANSASIVGNYNGSLINNRLDNQSATHFDPRLGVKYTFDNGFDVRGAIYENFSAPGMNQMYRSFVSGSNYTIPDPSLRPQTNQGGEVGVDYRSERFDLSLTAYENHLANYIDYSTVQSGCAASNNFCGTGVTSAATLKQYVNAGDATLRGFEVLGDWKPTESLTLNAGFARTDAFLTKSALASDPIDSQLGQVPIWIASAGVTWQATSQLSLTADGKVFPNYWNTTSHTQVNPGAAIVDVGFRYKFNAHFEMFGSVQNLFNQQYYDQGLSYNANGTVNTSSSGTVPALGIPFDATLGVKATF